MSTTLFSVKESDSPWDAISLMRNKGVRRIPVFDEEGSLAGILARDEVMELLPDEQGNLAGLVSCEQHKERLSRDLIDGFII